MSTKLRNQILSSFCYPPFYPFISKKDTSKKKTNEKGTCLMLQVNYYFSPKEDSPKKLNKLKKRNNRFELKVKHISISKVGKYHPLMYPKKNVPKNIPSAFSFFISHYLSHCLSNL